MSDTYGRTSQRQVVFYDPDGSCWRTWPAISLWGSETYSGTWPKRGSMRSGACYEHPTWEPPTNAPACSSSLPTPTAALSLLPTPVVNDMRAGKTPEAWDEWTADMQTRHATGNGHGRSLAIEAARLNLLPTPQCWMVRGEKFTRETSWRHFQEGRQVHLTQVMRDDRMWPGVDTSLPSDDGNTSSDDPPRLPLMGKDD